MKEEEEKEGEEENYFSSLRIFLLCSTYLWESPRCLSCAKREQGCLSP
jgi:hypothetical protein